MLKMVQQATSNIKSGDAKNVGWTLSKKIYFFKKTILGSLKLNSSTTIFGTT